MATDTSVIGVVMKLRLRNGERMWIRALSRSLMVVGGMLAVAYSIAMLDTVEGPDDFLYLGIIFMGACCMILGFRGRRNGDG